MYETFLSASLQISGFFVRHPSLGVPVCKSCKEFLDPDNYRGIFLLDVVGKILSKIIAERLSPIVEGILPDEQHGFRQTRQAAHAVLNFLAQQHAWDSGLSLWGFFVDIKKAFDSPARPSIYQVLRFLGVPESIIGLIKHQCEVFSGGRRKTDI